MKKIELHRNKSERTGQPDRQQNIHPAMKVIARIHTDFPTKFGIPRQSGLVDQLKGVIIFEEEFRNPEALRGLEGFTYIWLLWQFSESIRDNWSPMVRPPRLGGVKRMGVFATRSPFRPNPIGLSCVKLEQVDLYSELGPVLYVSGIDLMDNTPIYDIKPYLPYTDSHPEAAGGFADPVRDYRLEVEIPKEWLSMIPEDRVEALYGVLANDPRPAYQNTPDRIYGFEFCEFDVRFTVKDNLLKVCEIVRL